VRAALIEAAESLAEVDFTLEILSFGCVQCPVFLQ